MAQPAVMPPRGGQTRSTISAKPDTARGKSSGPSPPVPVEAWDAIERLTRGTLSLYETPRGDLVEFECDV